MISNYLLDLRQEYKTILLQMLPLILITRSVRMKVQKLFTLTLERISIVEY